MRAILDFIFMVGGILAAAAVAGGCGVGLLVWLSGRPIDPATEAWRLNEDR